MQLRTFSEARTMCSKKNTCCNPPLGRVGLQSAFGLCTLLSRCHFVPEFLITCRLVWIDGKWTCNVSNCSAMYKVSRTHSGFSCLHMVKGGYRGRFASKTVPSLFAPGPIRSPNRPIGPWPIRSLELSLLGPFAPWPFHSVANSFPGTFAPRPFRSPAFSLPGTKVIWNFCSVELSFLELLLP